MARETAPPSAARERLATRLLGPCGHEGRRPRRASALEGRAASIRATALALGLFCVSMSAGCGGSVADPDAGSDRADASARDASPSGCAADGDCDDGLYCNGVEACDPSSGAANRFGCVAGAAPCESAAACLEDEDRCATRCETAPDADGDGHDALECAGDDCDDTNADRHPGNTEVCDPSGRDEDCDVTTLGGPTDADVDGDGFEGVACCNQQTDGSLLCGTDCDDTRTGVNPGSPEACNGVDDDCDAMIDDGVLATFHRDVDGDMFGADDDSTMACSAPAGYAVVGGDCDDAAAGVNPGASESCDGVDNDCDGTIDEGVRTTFYRDTDGDMFGVDGDTTMACALPSGYAIVGGDCNDGVAGVNPGASESCDTVDNDCNGLIDDGAAAVTCYRDMDGDSFGDAGMSMAACFCPSGWVEPTLPDCHDANASVYPMQSGWFAMSYASPTGAASYDYDCNGVETRRWTVAKGGPCSSLASSGSRCNGQGWATATPPACGVEADWIDCVFFELEPFEPNRCVRASADVRRTQECH